MEEKELTLGCQLGGDLRLWSGVREPRVHNLGSTAACLPSGGGAGAVWGNARRETLPTTLLGNASTRFGVLGEVRGGGLARPDPPGQPRALSPSEGPWFL